MPYRILRCRWVPKWVKRSVAHVGRRGIILAFFGLLFLTSGRGWAESPPTEPENYAALLQMASFSFWGYLQMFVGVIMVTGAVLKRAEPWAFGTSAAVSALLAIGVLMSYWIGDPAPTAFRALVIYVFYTFFILIVSGWPETIQVIVVEKQEQDSDGP